MHGRLKNYALVICLFVFLFVMHRKRSAPDSGRGIHWCSVRHPACNLCFQSLVRCPISERGGAQRGTRLRDHPTARATMRFLLRLLLLLVLSSLPIEALWVLPTREPLAYAFGRERRTPEPSSWDNQGSSARRIGRSEPAAWSVAAPRPDARSNGSARYSKQYQKHHLSAGYTATVRPPFEYTNAMKHHAHAGLWG